MEVSFEMVDERDSIIDGGGSPNRNKRRKGKRKKNIAIMYDKIEKAPDAAAMMKIIANFKCDCDEFSSKEEIGGNCFERNFKSSDPAYIGKMVEILIMHREYTRTLNRHDKNEFAKNLWTNHCGNIEDVINPTEQISKLIRGESSLQSSSLLSPEEFFCGNCDTATFNSTSVDQCKSSCLCSNDSVDNFLRPPPSFLPSVKIPPSSSKTKKFDMNWDVKLEPGYLPDGKVVLKLCRASFAFLYGLAVNKFKAIPAKIKELGSSNISSASKTRVWTHRTYFGDEFTLDDISDVFDANLGGGVDGGNIEMKRAGFLRHSMNHIGQLCFLI